MKFEPNFFLSYQTLELLLEPLLHELQPYVIMVSFNELNKVSPWTLSADPKA
jgi:hypothetical protein